MKKNVSMTCIICPMGCTMDVELECTTNENGEEGAVKVLSVKDNGCKRGALYAQKEFQNPTRTLTTTIAVKGGQLPLVPVKTVGEVPKKMLFQCMEIIKRSVCKAPVKRGDVLIYDILGTGVNVAACADVKENHENSLL